MDTNKMYYRIRNICGFLGMILPWLSIVSVLLVKDRPEHSLWSISATYYLSPCLAAILSACSIVLVTYDGYDWRDNLVTTFMGVFGFVIVLFPCWVDWYDPSKPVGFFQIPMKMSHKFHCLGACGFFGLSAVNSFFLFTLGESDTKNKKARNIIYRVCGIGIVLSIVAMLICQKLIGGQVVMFFEILMLQFFGVSWLTKGNVWLKD